VKIPGLDDVPHQQTFDHVQRFRAVVRGNRCLIVRKFADELGFKIGSCNQIFTEKFQMRRVCSKTIPRFLTDDQKGKGVEISQELLANANANKNFRKSS
jgi:hypothetical protein